MPRVLRAEWDIQRYQTPNADIHAVYPPHHQTTARVRAFVDFLAEALSRGYSWRIAMKHVLCLLALVLPLAPQAGTTAPAAAAAPAASAPAKPASAAGDCAALRKRYRESADCYAPFLNVNGTRKPGAYEACGEPVPFPARECSSQPLR